MPHTCIVLSVCAGRLCSSQDVLYTSPASEPWLQTAERKLGQAGPIGEKTDGGIVTHHFTIPGTDKGSRAQPSPSEAQTPAIRQLDKTDLTWVLKWPALVRVRRRWTCRVYNMFGGGQRDWSSYSSDTFPSRRKLNWVGLCGTCFYYCYKVNEHGKSNVKKYISAQKSQHWPKRSQNHWPVQESVSRSQKNHRRHSYLTPGVGDAALKMSLMKIQDTLQWK